MRANAPLPNSLRRLVALAFALIATLSTSLAAAQLTGGGTPIAIVGNYPQRWLGCTATCDTPSQCTSPTDRCGCQTYSCPAGAKQNVRQPRNDQDKMPLAGINRNDCTSDEIWQFAFTLPPGVGFSTFEIWASANNTSCADVTSRAVTPPGVPQPNATCWLVSRFLFGDVSAQHVVAVRTRDIIKAVYQQKNYDDPSVTSASQICYPTGDTQPTRFYLHFLLVNNGQADNSGTESTYDTTYDLIGPPAPSNISLLSGGGLLRVNWSADTSSSTYGDFVSYRAYCFPKVGSENNPPYYGLDAGAFGEAGTTTTTDAGDDSGDAADTGDDSAADAADTSTTTTTTDASTSSTEGGTTGSCPPLPSVFTVGSVPTPDIEALKCAESGTFGNSLQISPLQNGVTYAVAIATIDLYGNSGALSNVACLDPEKTRDFYTTYTGDGGQAGGGYCAFGTARDRGGLAAALGVCGVALFLRRRHRRARGGR